MGICEEISFFNTMIENGEEPKKISCIDIYNYIMARLEVLGTRWAASFNENQVNELDGIGGGVMHGKFQGEDGELVDVQVPFVIGVTALGELVIQVGKKPETAMVLNRDVLERNYPGVGANIQKMTANNLQQKARQRRTRVVKGIK